MKKPIIIILALLLLSGPALSGPLKIHQPEAAYKLTGRDYYPELIKLIRNAQKSIYITMFIATYHPDHPKSPSNKLLQELVNAHKRGVKVRVILEQKRTYSHKEQYNDLAYLFLKDAGIQIYLDSPSTKLHDKLIIIDERIIIIGSHNWSKSALDRNRETSIVNICPALAREYIAWIESTPLAPRYTPPPETTKTSIFIPYQFLSNPKAGSRLVRLHAAQAFDLYLYLLSRWNNTPFLLDYRDAALFLGIEKNEYIRRDINRLLRKVSDKYHLLKVKIKHRQPAQITLLDYKNKHKMLHIAKEEAIIVPGGFEEFGWIRRLTTPGKYFYLISLLETKLSFDPRGWWSHSQRHLDNKYHLVRGTFSHGIMELNRYNLLKVDYGELVYPFDKYLTAPNYLLLPLYSWDWHQKELAKIEELYGKEKFTQARQWAELVQEENNLEVIEKLINYANEYGTEPVQFAVDKVAEKRIGNPKRSFAYIEGIILKAFRDQQEEEED